MSASIVERATPCAELATEPTTPYSMPRRSRASTTAATAATRSPHREPVHGEPEPAEHDEGTEHAADAELLLCSHRGRIMARTRGPVHRRGMSVPGRAWFLLGVLPLLAGGALVTRSCVAMKD